MKVRKIEREKRENIVRRESEPRERKGREIKRRESERIKRISRWKQKNWASPW